MRIDVSAVQEGGLRTEKKIKKKETPDDDLSGVNIVGAFMQPLADHFFFVLLVFITISQFTSLSYGHKHSEVS